MSVTITKSEYATLLALIADSRAKAKEAEDLLEGLMSKSSESGVKSKKVKSKKAKSKNKFNLHDATNDELSKMKVVDLKKILGEYITVGGGFRRKEDIVNSLIYVRDHPNATQDEIINRKASKASKTVPKAKASKTVSKTKTSKAKASDSKNSDFKVEDGEGYSWKMIEGVKFVIPLDGSNVVIGKVKTSGVGPFTKADEDILKECKIKYEKLKAPMIKTRISEAKEAMQSGEKSNKKKSKAKSSDVSSSESRLLTRNDSSDTSNSSDEKSIKNDSSDTSSSSDEKPAKDDESSSSSDEKPAKDDESSSSSDEKPAKDDESSSSSDEKSTKDDESSSSSDDTLIAVTRDHYTWFVKHKDDLDEDEFINDFDVSEKEARLLLKDLTDNFDKFKLQFDPPKPKKPRGIAGKGRGRGKAAMKYVKK